MKTETITQTILTADEGMYLTNGESIATTVVLPLGADVSVWNEITEEEKEKMEMEALENA